MKRKVVLFGNCQAAGVHKALADLDGGEQFDIVHHDMLLTGGALEASLKDYADCDILLLQDITYKWRTHPMKDRIAPGARIISFAPLGFMALWPFDGLHCGPDPAWAAQPARKTFAYSDHLMARLRGSVPDPNGMIADPAERLRVYAALDWPKLDSPRRYLAFERRRLLQQDDKHGSRMGRFILDNFASTRLFHTLNHPTGLLLRELALEVLGKIGLDVAAVEDMDLDGLGGVQVPVHPGVADTLDLGWVGSDERYRLNMDVELDFLDYYRLYIDTYG